MQTSIEQIGYIKAINSKLTIETFCLTKRRKT